MEKITNFLKKNKFFLCGLLFLIVLCFLWEFLVKAFKIESYVFPSFSSVIKSLFKLLKTSFFYKRFLGTIIRVFVSLLLSLAFGLVFGLIGGLNKYFNACFKPIISLIKSIPIMAITLIIMLNYGKQNTPIVIGFMMGFPIIYSSTVFGIENLDKKQMEMLKIYKVPFKKRLFKVYIPQVLPSFFNGLETCGGLCIKAVISAEILCYTVDSIGNSMRIAGANFNTDTPILFAYCLVAIMFSLLFELFVKFIVRLVIKWK